MDWHLLSLMLLLISIIFCASSESELNNSNNDTRELSRKKRELWDNLFFITETEAQIRVFLYFVYRDIDPQFLPKFGGKGFIPPYANLIQPLSHSRSYRDGPIGGDYILTTSDVISLSIDPVIHRLNKIRWAIYGGSRDKRCLQEAFYGVGNKAVFSCWTPGIYYAFFQITGTYRDETDVVHGVRFASPETRRTDYDGLGSLDGFFLDPTLLITDFEFNLFRNQNQNRLTWYFSDPIKIEKQPYCYRWAYRLILTNEVGFVHMEPNPLASTGVYREYVLKVLVVDPAGAAEEELNHDANVRPMAYSQALTKRFQWTGILPCIRFAHKSIEVTSDAKFMPDGDTQKIKNKFDSTRLHSPYWEFKLKVYLDKMVSTLSDVQFTITPRQHTALYDCFIADVRVYVPARTFKFLPVGKVASRAINLKYSTLTDVRHKFISDNVVNYFGHGVVYTGPPYILDKSIYFPVISNPCIIQEMAMVWKGTIEMTEDFCNKLELQKIVLPSFDLTRLALNPVKLKLSKAEVQTQQDRINNETYAKDKSLKINIIDIAYTPADLIFLLEDSSILLHSTDLSLKGIAYNTLTQKYKLDSLVKRKWCASTSTPKNHNMWVPAYSRENGNFIIIYQIPSEGAQVIKSEVPSFSCESPQDSTAHGKRQVQRIVLNETEIHIDEIDDARIDLSAQAKLRTKSALLKLKKRDEAKVIPKTKTLADLSDEKTFWMAGPNILDGNDLHFASGANDAKNVHIATSGLEKYNEHVVFEIDVDFTRIRTNFEINGLSFELDEEVNAPGGNRIIRDATNSRLFNLHAVQFTGVEKQYLLAVGFQSLEFRKSLQNINSTTVIVCTFVVNDLPIVISGTDEDAAELEDINMSFSGTIFRRLVNSASGDVDEYTLTAADITNVVPLPLSKHTALISSINTALPLYVIRLNDVIAFASLDGSFAKPILCYEDLPTLDTNVAPKPILPFKRFDIEVTEQGMISALSRQEFRGDKPTTASEAFIGSVLINEPLRYIHPFHINNEIFQTTTEEGEIVYGKLSYNNETESINSPPETEMLSIPFWSLLKGSFGHSAGDISIPLDRQTVSSGQTSGQTVADPLCPFASFDVYYVLYPYVEAGYKTRITAEVAYYGDVIPLEADVIVEFSEVQGVSVVVNSLLEVEYDQTIVRKTIEIDTFLPAPQLQFMYNRHYSVQSDDENQFRERANIFTLTIRPSALNLQCNKKDYFKTIQMSIGCVPLSKMRLIAEAVPVTKVKVDEWTDTFTPDDMQSNWFYQPEDALNKSGISYLVLSKENVHKDQYKLFDCITGEICKIPIPAGYNIEDNVYKLSFRDILIPKFEQALTQHVRRVSGNIVMYDILDAFKEEEFQMETNTTQHQAACIVDDGNWYQAMAEQANFYTKELSLKADIYRYFNNCFSHLPSYKTEDVRESRNLLPLQKLSQRKFFVFNRTNRNALSLKRKRNYIYLIRAVVVNTEYNGYTYCRKLDTYFVLQVDQIAQVKKKIESYMPYIYLLIIVVFLVFFLILYIYFANTFVWTVDLEPTKTIQEQQEEDKIIDELHRKYKRPENPYQRLARRIRDMEKVRRGAAAYRQGRAEEREALLGSSKRSKSESRKDEAKVSFTKENQKLEDGPHE